MVLRVRDVQGAPDLRVPQISGCPRSQYDPDLRVLQILTAVRSEQGAPAVKVPRSHCQMAQVPQCTRTSRPAYIASHTNHTPHHATPPIIARRARVGRAHACVHGVRI